MTNQPLTPFVVVSLTWGRCWAGFFDKQV